MRITSLVLHGDWSAALCQEIVACTSSYEADVTLYIRNRMIDMKSMLGLCSLALRTGDTIEVRAGGYDEEEAIEAVKCLLRADRQL